MTALHLDARHREGVERPLIGSPLGLADDRLLDAVRDAARASRVVGIVVREDERVDAVDPQPVEAGCRELGVPPGVDHRDRAAVTEEEGVALPHIAGGDLPVGGDGEHTSDRSSAQRRREHETPAAEDHARSPADRARERSPEDEQRHEHERARAQQDADRPADPRQGAPGQLAHRVGDLGDPRGREPRQPHEQLADRGRPGQEEAGEAAENRRDGRGGLGQEVRRDPVEREGRREEDEHRLAGQLRRERDGDREGQRARHPAREDAGQRPGQDEKTGGREDGEGETVVARQPGVVQEQHDHGQ